LLRLQFYLPNYDIAEVIGHLSRIEVRELYFDAIIEYGSSDNWETDFELIRNLKKFTEGNDHLKRIELGFAFRYEDSTPAIVSAEARESWIKLKDELKSICVKQGIEVGSLTCSFGCCEGEGAEGESDGCWEDSR
jgi:hypothetical protein